MSVNDEDVQLVCDSQERHEIKKAKVFLQLEKLPEEIQKYENLARTHLAMGDDAKANVHLRQRDKLRAEQERLQLSYDGLLRMDASVARNAGRHRVNAVLEERALAVAKLPPLLEQMTKELSDATNSLKAFLHTSYVIKKCDAEIGFVVTDSRCSQPKLDPVPELPVERFYQLLADFRTAMGGD